MGATRPTLAVSEFSFPDQPSDALPPADDYPAIRYLQDDTLNQLDLRFLTYSALSEARERGGSVSVLIDAKLPYAKVLEFLRGPEAPTAYLLPWIELDRKTIELVLHPPHLRERLDADALHDPELFTLFLREYWGKYTGWYAYSQMTLEDWKRHATKCASFHEKGQNNEYRGAAGELLLDLQLRLLQETVARNVGGEVRHIRQYRDEEAIGKINAMVASEDQWCWLSGYNVKLMRHPEHPSEPNIVNAEFDGGLSCWDDEREIHYVFDAFCGSITNRRKYMRNWKIPELLTPEAADRMQKIGVIFSDAWIDERLLPKYPNQHTVILPTRGVVETVGELTEKTMYGRPLLRGPISEAEWEAEYALVRGRLDRMMREEWEAWRRQEERAAAHDEETVMDVR